MSEAMGTVMPGGVLAYVTGARTPTRVRVVAGRGMVVWGVVWLVPAGLVFYMLGAEAYEAARVAAGKGIWRGGAIAAPAHLVTLSEYRMAAWLEVRAHPMWVMMMGMMGGLGLCHILLSRGVRRGVGWASVGSAAAVVPAIGVLVVGATVMGCAALLEVHERSENWGVSGWGVVAAILGLPVVATVVLVVRAGLGGGAGRGGRERDPMAAMVWGLGVVMLILTGVMAQGRIYFLMRTYLPRAIGGDVHLWWMIGGAGMALVTVMILKDLTVFLWWIARHPGTERGTARILPGGAAEGAV